MGCLRQNLEQRTRQTALGETEEVRRQEDNHSSQDLQGRGEQQADSPRTDPEPEERPPDSQGVEEEPESQPEENGEPRKSQVKWPPSNAEKEWNQLDEDLEGILENVLAGTAEKKIEAMMRIVHSVGSERYTRQLLGAKTSGKLTASIEEVQAHLRTTHGDQERDRPLEGREEVLVPEPTHPMDCSEPKLAEVEEVIRKARAGSAPGPSGITYKVYKKCPKLRKRLWKLIRVLWRKGKIPEGWMRAEGVFCPKQENAESIEQFRTISLLSVECKIFFAVLAKRLVNYMLLNKYIDTAIQKGGVPGFSGCLEHTSIITQLIREAKQGKKDLAVVWLDLENAYGSVPHQLIKKALMKYHVPQQACRVISQYLDGLQIRFTVDGRTTAWQRLQRGIITGCTVSVMLFVAAMNLVMEPAVKQSRGPTTNSGTRQKPLKAFMDDLTITTESVLSARWTLRSLEEKATWARMKFKARKCRKLVLRKGKLSNRIQLEIQREKIPSVTEQPIKSLGKKFDLTLGDKNNIREFKEQVEKGLKAIEQSKLPGKFKAWCYQYGLLPRISWPMTMYDISLTTVEEVERKISRHLRKWLGLPPSFTRIGLYCRTARLQLPFTSAVEEFKVCKTRAFVTLESSSDENVSKAGVVLRTGRKWSVEKAVEEARSNLRHRDIVGVVAQGRLGLGAGNPESQRWSTAGPKERRDMVQKEVRRREEEGRRSQAVSQGVQGAWTKWEGVRDRRVMWSELHRWEPLRTQFLVKAVYDLLPTPVNKKRWGMQEEESCGLCGKRGTLSHILSGCKVALSQGRYRWRHDRVLRVLAAVVEEERTRKRQQVDLDRKLTFPEEVVATNLRPDMVLWSKQAKKVTMIELTVPWEERVEEAHERKALKYQDLVQSCKDNGWRAMCFPVEVGTRGFICQSTWRMLGAVGVKGRRRREVTKRVAEEAERASRWLWVKSTDGEWIPKNLG
ncbi:hypothetical protein Bbelb_072230 [Branchiostoma belcheri]|nr:hypothetical protein Bbelb_072230 [Branchiostoma belcheri]